jgi:cell division protease FtsH
MTSSDLSKPPSAQPPRESRPESPRPEPPKSSPPWRTEGLPTGQPPGRRPRWLSMILWAAAGLLLFGTLTMQERLSEPDAVSYTEFKHQVEAKNVHEVFAHGESIEGRLKKEEPLPDRQDRRYQQFTTERPTFAKDDLLGELTSTGATVRAKPIVQQRGFLMNILASVAPLVLLFVFWSWMLRRQQSAMGGMLGGGKQRRVDPETVRVTFADVAGIDEVEAEINEVVDFLKDPDKYRRLGCCYPARPALARRCSRAPPLARPRSRSSARARPSSSR